MSAAVILWGCMWLLAIATVVLGRAVRRAKARQAELLRLVQQRLAAFGA